MRVIGSVLILAGFLFISAACETDADDETTDETASSINQDHDESDSPPQGIMEDGDHDPCVLKPSPNGRFVSSGTYQQVDAGKSHTCAIDLQGALECWGENKSGETDAPSGTFQEISMGREYSCGIDDSGAIECWGEGINNVMTDKEPPSGSFQTLAVDGDHACAIADDDSVQCWGWDAPYDNRLDLPDGSYEQVMVSSNYTCALETSGSIVCEGHDVEQGTMEGVPSGEFKQITSGGVHGRSRSDCAIDSDDAVVCWGGKDVAESSASDGAFAEVSAGFRNYCGLRPDGTLECWDNLNGEPTDSPEGTYTQLSSHTGHNCAIRDDDRVVCWGSSSPNDHLAPPCNPDDFG